MQRLTNKRVVLGVTGSVAAYKAGEVIRELQRAGAEVRVVMTRGAEAFVAPLTFQALSGHPVHRELLDPGAEAAMGHIALARWADCILVAPASADFLARLAAGRADDLLTAVCLARGVPLALAPAMNARMWEDAATRANVQTLRNRGVLFLGPEEGDQACGEEGPGRLLDPVVLAARLGELFEVGSLQGRRVLVTAGPTREPLDPVRFFSNRSSGRMGFAVAAAAAEAGARVTLVAGPVALESPDRVERVDVTTAEEMLAAVSRFAPEADVFISAAAVADYRPREVRPGKIKRTGESLTVELVPNPDILATVKSRWPQVFCVGFAAETGDLDRHARAKLAAKGVELIAANLVGPAAPEAGGVFGTGDNALTLYWEGGSMELGLAPKDKLARALVAAIAQRLAAWEAGGGGTVVSLHRR